MNAHKYREVLEDNLLHSARDLTHEITCELLGSHESLYERVGSQDGIVTRGVVDQLAK